MATFRWYRSRPLYIDARILNQYRSEGADDIFQRFAVYRREELHWSGYPELRNRITKSKRDSVRRTSRANALRYY